MFSIVLHIKQNWPAGPPPPWLLIFFFLCYSGRFHRLVVTGVLASGVWRFHGTWPFYGFGCLADQKGLVVGRVWGYARRLGGPKSFFFWWWWWGGGMIQYRGRLDGQTWMGFTI